MDSDNGRVRVKGPLGLSRVARTEVVTAERPRELRGRAELSGATTGAVRWEIAPVPGGSQVSFSAHVEQASLLDRLLLLAGGRWWLGRIVRAAVGRLGAVLDAQLAVNS